MADLAKEHITFALLPISSGPQNMTEAAAMIQAKYDIPIHTKVGLDLPYDTTKVAKFLSPNKLIVLPKSTIGLLKEKEQH